MWAPVFKTKDGKRFVFAYQDQLYYSEEEAMARGVELQLKTVDDSIEFTKEVIDAKDINTSDVTTVNGFALCFLKVKKKNERGRRKTRNIS